MCIEYLQLLRITTGYTANINYICFDGKYLWMTNNSAKTVSKYADPPGSALQSISITGTSEGMCFDGTYIWVIYQSPNQVVQISAVDCRLIQTIALPAGPLRSVLMESTSGLEVMDILPKFK